MSSFFRIWLIIALYSFLSLVALRSLVILKSHQFPVVTSINRSGLLSSVIQLVFNMFSPCQILQLKFLILYVSIIVWLFLKLLSSLKYSVHIILNTLLYWFLHLWGNCPAFSAINEDWYLQNSSALCFLF